MCRLQVCLRDRTVLELWIMNMNAAEPEPRKCCKSVGLPGQKWANVETPSGYTLRGFTEHPSTAVKKANNAAVLAARQVGEWVGALSPSPSTVNPQPSPSPSTLSPPPSAFTLNPRPHPHA